MRRDRKALWEYERQAYERRRTRNETRRDRRYHLALILAVLLWAATLLWVVETPARSIQTPAPETPTPTPAEIRRVAILAASDVNREAQEDPWKACEEAPGVQSGESPESGSLPAEQAPERPPEAVYYHVPLDRELQDALRSACEEFDVDMALALAVIRRETAFQNLVGDDGKSLGFMQIQQRWHEERMERLGVTDLMDPPGNFRVGCCFLAELLEDYPLENALAYYNGGSPDPTERTRRYAQSVMGYMEEYRQCHTP